MIRDGFYPLNSSTFDPNVRGESPEGFVIVRDIAVGALTAGAVTITLTGIPFGKDLGEIFGVHLIAGAITGDSWISTDDDDQHVLLAVDNAVAGTNEGEVDVDVIVTDSASTVDDLVISLVLYGRVLPKDA